MSDTLRNAELEILAQTLNSQRVRSLDVVVSAKSLVSNGGLITVHGTEDHLDDDGVTKVDGRYEATIVGDEGFSKKLGIPMQYLKKLHDGHPEPYDSNLNYWLERSEDRYLLRLLRAETNTDFTDGVIRAVLSDSYRTIDNFDIVLAALKGVRAAGDEAGWGLDDVQVEADLTVRRMHVRITSKVIAAQALALVDGYRSPYDTGRLGRDYPLVFAGLEISNSEVGEGKFKIVPRVTWQVCTNGQKFTEDAMEKVHLGAKMNEGVVKASEKTVAANIALVTSQTQDAVRTFLSEEYVQSKLDGLAEDMGVEISKPETVITDVSKSLGFSKDETEEILGAFIKGGSMTAGGVMQAVTAHAQTLPDGDAAYDMEAAAGQALKLAATIGRRS